MPEEFLLIRGLTQCLTPFVGDKKLLAMFFTMALSNVLVQALAGVRQPALVVLSKGFRHVCGREFRFAFTGQPFRGRQEASRLAARIVMGLTLAGSLTPDIDLSCP